MKYKELFGNNIKEDIEEIKRDIDKDSSTVFVYSGTDTLYDYIDALYDKSRGLDAEYLYKFKICYEKKDLQVSYSARGGERSREIISMSSLINELDDKSSCKIVVENNDRVQLSFIVQQLIFIEYPLEKVDILLKKEEKDADRTKRFMKNVNELLNGCKTAINRLKALRHKVETENDNNNPTKSERLKDIDGALDSCTLINKHILKSIDVELKLAVAASKKAGKSVIVNCFLGEQIAPTSTELATPNNCIYKKSPDKKYHLQLESNSKQEFDTREEIYDVINEYFRAAQNDKEQGFSLPDMHIEYVTEENNFSSYTIFDTAGPDAAGTHHAYIAEKAIQKCDVAVFAIDYSKYLTTSEESYLHKIKEIFTAQNKFHSLIFALNKIDVRYTDIESPKSFIMSVDFIKTRLAKIDEAYKDCIIFPTCSLEYFNVIEAEKAGITELNAENNLPIEEMRRIKFAHKNVPVLAWLHTHSENLQYYHDIQTISYDVFKKDSGMPALMNYVSYVAQSKARDEIVNNITFEIDSQQKKIQIVLDHIANIEALINADDKKIKKISKIITDYTNSVQNILSPNINQDDLNNLNEKSLLRQNADYKELMKHQEKALKSMCDRRKLSIDIYHTMVAEIWKKLNGVKKIKKSQIDNLFTQSDFKKVVNKVCEARILNAANTTYCQLTKLKDDIKVIAENRKHSLLQISDECRKELEKEHIYIILPSPSDFEFSTTLTPPNEVITEFKYNYNFKLYNRLSIFFKGAFFKNIFKPITDENYEFRFKTPSKQEFLNVFEYNLKDFIKNIVYENHIAEDLSKKLTESVVDKYMASLLKEMENTFDTMNETYTFYINRFRSAIDDRGKYIAEKELHNLRKENIEYVKECTSDFMKTWDIIIKDVIDDKIENSEKLLLTT